MFDSVIATDASEKQITNAALHERVDYRVALAEDSGIDSGTVDLIMAKSLTNHISRFYSRTAVASLPLRERR